MFKKKRELKSWSEEPEREKNLSLKKSLVAKR